MSRENQPNPEQKLMLLKSREIFKTINFLYLTCQSTESRVIIIMTDITGVFYKFKLALFLYPSLLPLMLFDVYLDVINGECRRS